MAITVKEFTGKIGVGYWTPRGDVTRVESQADRVVIQIQDLMGKSIQFTVPVEDYDRDMETELAPINVDPKWNVRLSSFWLLNRKIYEVNDRDVSLEDVKALLNLKSNQRRLQLEKAHALQAMVDGFDEKRKRAVIPQSIRLEVWQRDGGRCVDCSSQENLEFDHVIPHSMGGADTARNLQLLCEKCNRRKGASLG